MEVPEESKGKVTTESVKIFFDNLKGLFDKHQYSKELITNYDETMVQMLHQKKKVMVPIGQAPVSTFPLASLLLLMELILNH